MVRSRGGVRNVSFRIYGHWHTRAEKTLYVPPSHVICTKTSEYLVHGELSQWDVNAGGRDLCGVYPQSYYYCHNRELVRLLLQEWKRWRRDDDTKLLISANLESEAFMSLDLADYLIAFALRPTWPLTVKILWSFWENMSFSSDDRSSSLWNASTCPNVLPRCESCELPIHDPKVSAILISFWLL